MSGPPDSGGRRPTLTLKRKDGGKPAVQVQPAQTQPPATQPAQATQVQEAAAPLQAAAAPVGAPGPAAPPERKPPARFMSECFMVMRDRGQRPKARHRTLNDARLEAGRIAAGNPGDSVWIMRCEVIETLCVQAPADAGGAEPASAAAEQTAADRAGQEES